MEVGMVYRSELTVSRLDFNFQLALEFSSYHEQKEFTRTLVNELENLNKYLCERESYQLHIEEGEEEISSSTGATTAREVIMRIVAAYESSVRCVRAESTLVAVPTEAPQADHMPLLPI
jgi:hypothetical protein